MIAGRGLSAACLAAILSLLPAACISRHLAAGVTDESSRAALRVGVIVYVKQDGLYLARGDGSGARRLLAGNDAGGQLTILHAALSPAADRVAFLSVNDLDVRERTGRGLSLQILTLTHPADPAAAVSGWRRSQLEKIAPPGPGGRQEIFTAAALAWSRDGSRIAIGLNRPPAAGGDAVLLLDSVGVPLLQYDLAPHDLAPVSSISWTPDSGAVLLGGQIDEGADTATGVILRLEFGESGAARGASITDVGTGRYPVISPDGTRIAVVVERSGTSDLLLLDMSGREVERFPRPAGRGLTRPQWSADGRYLYYYSLASTGPLGLVDITMLRCLDTRTRQVFDLARL